MKAEMPTSPGLPRSVPRARFRFPLRAKITIPYLILAIGLAVGAGYMVLRIVFDTADERFSNQLIETEKLCVEGMVREESRLLKTLRLVAFTDGLAEALGRGDTQALTELTIGVTAAQGEEEVALLDSHGDVVLEIHQSSNGGATEFIPVYGNATDFAAQPFVEKVLSGTIDAEGDKFSGVAFHNQRYMFYVSGPVKDSQGQLVGVVLVGKSLQTLANQLREETLSQVTLYDLQGNILATTLAEALPLDADTAATLISNKDTSSLRRKGSDQRSFNIFDLQYTELLGAWQVRSTEVIGVLGASLANNYWITASTPTRVQMFSLIAVLILLVFVIGVEIADRIANPIQNLVAASSEVAAGNFDVKLQATGNDEVGYLTAAFNTMVENLDKSRMDLIQAYDETIEGWAIMLDQRDEDTEGHTRRVTELALEVARHFGLSAEELVQIRRGALLHDIGKISVPDHILKKKGKLTPEEWEVMRLHPVVAFNVLSSIEYLRPALDIPYAHHERWDGSGYPRGLRGEEIPLAARIFSVIDVWDAMTSDRPYRPAMDPQEVLDHIFTESGKLFDPQVVEVFWDVIHTAHPNLSRPDYIWQPAVESA